VNRAQLAALVGQAAAGPREFAAGWIEGRTRYRNARGRQVLPSWFGPRTTGRAASQAAVAFYRSLDGQDA
jgi:hypothetical protein